MLSKQQMQFIKSLSIKKYRQEYGRFIAEVNKIVSEMFCDKQFINTIEKI